MIYDDEGHKMPSLAVVGVKRDGDRELLAFTVGDRENQTAWEGLFEELRQRGVKHMGLWVTDGHHAMLNALTAKFPQAPRQRCLKHKLENVLSYLPDKQRAQVQPELRALFYQPSREQADQAIAAFCAKYESV